MLYEVYHKLVGIRILSYTHTTVTRDVLWKIIRSRDVAQGGSVVFCDNSMETVVQVLYIS